MKEIIGDIWEADLDLICITTNGNVNSSGEAIMGKGIAKQAADRFPGIKKIIGSHISHFGNTPRLYRNYPLLEETYIISLPTKHHWRNFSDINLIEKSIIAILEIVDANPNFRRIGMTRPGCGNGGLDWNKVKPFIKPLLDDRFIIFRQEKCDSYKGGN